MKALILAAGFGHRMRPLTDDQPKTLLSVNGRCVIDRILDSLRLHGIGDICIVTGYRAEQLRAHVVEQHPDLRFQFVHNGRYDKTNNIFSMALAFEEMTFDSDVLLIESDLVYEPAALARLLDSPYENVALVDHYRPGMDGTVVALSSQRTITHVIPPSQQSDTFDFSDKYKTLNIYRFAKEFCETTFRRLLTYYAQVIDDNCYYEYILGMLIYMQQAEIHAEVLAGERWAELDDPNDLRRAELAFNGPARFDMLEESCGGYWETDLVDFAFIRNLHFPTPAVLSELRNSLPTLLWNYGSRQEVVDRKLAWFADCPVGFVHALAGASQCFPWLRTWLAGRRVLIPEPTFGEYRRMFPDAATYADAPGLAWSEIEAEADRAEVVVFVNPNNPTGTTVGADQVVEFAEARPGTVVLVDESFADFSGRPSVLEAMAREPLDNVVVLKSLSKCLGVPGLRLGLLATSNAELGAVIRRETPIWSLSAVAEHFLELLLKHRGDLARSFRRTADDRDDLAGGLARLAVVDQVHPSGGDFLLARLRTSPAESVALARRLADRSRILVKDVSTRFGGELGHWRLAVRTPADHSALVAAIEACTPARYRRS